MTGQECYQGLAAGIGQRSPLVWVWIGDWVGDAAGLDASWWLVESDTYHFADVGSMTWSVIVLNVVL